MICSFSPHIDLKLNHSEYIVDKTMQTITRAQKCIVEEKEKKKMGLSMHKLEKNLTIIIGLNSK